MISRIRKFFSSPSMQYLLLILIAIASAFINEIFIFPNAFAPSGINGIATMVQYLFGIRVGVLSLIINIPMLVVAFFVLDRSYALKTFTFIAVFSVTLILLDRLDLSSIVYQATDTGGAILAAVAGGLFGGAIYSASIRVGGSTGGTDVIAAFINKKYPEYDTVWIIFILNVLVAVISFFVYGMRYQPVILCAVYVFVNSKVGDTIFKGAKSAAKFEVITTRPEELSRELIETLHHGCTVIPAKGGYTQNDKFLLVCVVNRRQSVEFERIIRKYPDTFAYISTVNGTVGQFQRVK